MNDKTSSQGSQEPIDKTLAVLVNEYLKKSNLPTTSATLCAEAHLPKITEESSQQTSFLSDWFRFMFSLLQSLKNSQVNESDAKRFLESSRQLFDLHKIAPLLTSVSSAASSQSTMGGASAGIKSEGFSGKFGGQEAGEPPSKLHAGQNQNGKTPSVSTPGSKHPHATAPGATNGMSAPPLSQANFAQGGSHQLRPQFNLSLPSHSAGALANWPGAQGMSMPGSAMSNPMQQSSDGSTSQQMVPYGINGHMSNGSMPPNALQAGSGFDPSMMAMQNASPAGLKGSMPQQQQQFLSPQQQQLLAQQQSNQQRNMLYQQNQRYLMQQQIMAGGVVNPQMAYMNPNSMVGANNNRMIPMYQQREVYAQHHKQVQLLKLQQHTARQQLMATQRGGNVGPNMGQALGQALGRPGENPVHMGSMGYPGNHALSHPGGAQNPLLMQQMMNMGAMPNFNGTSSAQHHPMANGMSNMASNNSMAGNPNSSQNQTPNQSNPNQPGASNPSQAASGATSTPNPSNGNGSSANVNFEALFASMHSSGVNMNGNLANMGSMANSQTVGSSSAAPNEQGKPANQEEDNSKIFGKFIDSDIFSMNDASGTGNSQSAGATGSQIGDQAANLDIFTLDPFSHSEFFS